MELWNGNFPNCCILIPKWQKATNGSRTFLLNHEAGSDVKDYLVHLRHAPPSLPNHSVIKQVIIKGNFNRTESLTSLLSLSLLRITLWHFKIPSLTGTVHLYRCSHSHYICLWTSNDLASCPLHVPPFISAVMSSLNVMAHPMSSLHTILLLPTLFLPSNTPILIKLQTLIIIMEKSELKKLL